MGNKKNNIKKPGVKTLSIHHGETFAEDTGCVMPPIFSYFPLFLKIRIKLNLSFLKERFNNPKKSRIKLFLNNIQQLVVRLFQEPPTLYRIYHLFFPLI